MERTKPIRILSLILAACLILTLLPPISSIADATEALETPNVLRAGIEEIRGNFSPFDIGGNYDQEIVNVFTGHLLGCDREGDMILNGMEGETRAYNGVDYTYNTMANCVVTQNQDGTVDYDLTMRSDLRFSDGVPATIDDVIFGIYVMADPIYDGNSLISSLPIEGMEDYHSSMTPLADAIFADGPDGYVANERYTEAQYNEFWTYYNEQAGTDFAQEIIDYCVTNYLSSAPDYIGATEEEVMADAGLQVKLGMTLWGFGEDWFEGASAADFWTIILSHYDSAEEAEEIESAGSDRLSLTKQALGKEYQVGVINWNEAINISGVIKTGPYSLRIHCTSFDVNTIYSLDLPIAPLHHYGDLSLYDYDQNSFGFPEGDLRIIRSKNADPLGCGPYVFTDYADGIVTLEANPFYFKGEPKIETLQYRPVTYSGTPNAITNDEIDLRDMGNYNLDSVYLNNSNGQLNGDKISAAVYDYPGFGYMGINAERVSVGSDAASRQSKNLRLAIMTVLAVCREAAVSSYYGERASVIQYPISNTSWAAPHPGDAGYRSAYSTDVNGNPIYTDGMTENQRYEAAVQAALGFLEAAGYTVENGRVVAAPAGAKGLSESDSYEVVIPGQGLQDHPAYGIAAMAQELLGGIGFVLSITDVGFNEWNSYVFNNECDLWAAAWQTGPDPDMYPIYHSANANVEGSSNHFQIQDDELDELIMEACSTADSAERKAAYREALDIILSWGVELPTYQRKCCCLFSTERVNLSTLPTDITAYWGWIDEVENLEMNIHIWDEGVTVEPSCTEDGSVTYTCTLCGETTIVILPALGHIFERGVCTRCGYAAQAASEIFDDVRDGKWYAEAVLWAVQNGITTGTGERTFSPNDTCTRAQVVTFLWHAEKDPNPSNTENPFTDNREGKWYYNAVLWAYHHDPQITSGSSETTFGVNNGCTREQVVTFLWKTAGAPEPETTENPFTDVSEGKWYYKSVLWAYENGITSGITEDTFGVHTTCTRAQIVTFLYKAYGQN